MQKIHEEEFESEFQWMKSETRQEYYLDPGSGRITLVITERMSSRDFGETLFLDTKVLKSVLNPNDIPFVVRKKAKAILDPKP
jgi:hypothetical protein